MRAFLFIVSTILVASCGNAKFHSGGGSADKAAANGGGADQQVIQGEGDKAPPIDILPDTDTDTKTSTSTDTTTATSTTTTTSTGTGTGTGTGTSTSVQCGLPAGYRASGYKIKRASTDELFVGGSFWSLSEQNAAGAVWKFKNDGTLDTTYGNNGKFLIHRNVTNGEGVTDLEVLADGSVIGASTGLTTGPIIFKLDPNGVRDSSFSVGATHIEKISDTSFYGAAGGALLKFDNNGQADASFGNNGRVSFVYDNHVYELAVTANGKALVLSTRLYQVSAGETPTLNLTQFNTDGSIDQSFGTNGVVVIPDKPFGNTSTLVLKRLANGQILFAGFKGDQLTPGRSDAVLHLFNQNGTYVNTFGTGGVFSRDFSGSGNYDHFFAADEFGDGSLILAGWYMTGNQEYLISHIDRMANAVSPIGYRYSPLSWTGTQYLHDVLVRPNDNFWVTGNLCGDIFLALFDKQGNLQKRYP